MKIKVPRALAYALAKPIDIHCFDHVSGGNNGVNAPMCSTETLRASGMTRQDMDVSIDFRIDW